MKNASVKVIHGLNFPPKRDTTEAMKKPRLTTASTVVLLFVLSGHEAVCKSRGHFSGVGFDFATGGYHDVAVIVSPELSRAECPQILDDVKVGAETTTIHIDSLEDVLNRTVIIIVCNSILACKLCLVTHDIQYQFDSGHFVPRKKWCHLLSNICFVACC